VAEVLDLVRMAELADRPAAKLSGGQQQRLALARAVVARPELLLLDEPLSNLDAQLRLSMRHELQRLQQELGLTAVFVTHDQHEALAVSTTVAVMRDGRIVQSGSPKEVYDAPATRFVAEFVGTSNFVEGRVAGAGAVVETEHGPLRVQGQAVPAAGTEVLLAVRPEHLLLAVEPSPAEANGWRGVVRSQSFLGETIEHVVDVGPRALRVRTAAAASVAPGTTVGVVIPPERLRLVAPD
jgi:iron(III) transport system ATP-binding protein